MFSAQIITMGSCDKNTKILSELYEKRLKPYMKLEIRELPEIGFGKNDKEKTKKQEAEKILKIIKPNTHIVALHETGLEMTSKKFADYLETTTERGTKICFIIGGALGLHETILKKAHAQLSLSKFTFPHQIARILLLEQLYRANTILLGKEYHY